ncbi:hypothetical protein C5167_050607 [Papaver somniferum]|uniref:Amino acid transporter transmembrane domain-containing protein n=1 Tax=Papaver somniferum TaxID=3469 RepID=A0A4Y7KSJ4_PAPSO|nr:proline transporter 1-like [Papaver somniferum]RZC75128.1 hypothetical protein C5167_050607 [Papaver somniferum]
MGIDIKPSLYEDNYDQKTSNRNTTYVAQVFDVDQQITPTSAHTIDHDSWKQVGLLMVTSFNCGYILSFSNLMLVPLGWTWGIICLIVIALFTFYSSWLLAGFHLIDGQRFIRYRDLMGFVFGRKMYYVTWILQFFTLVMGNMGFILLGGRALKEINSEFINDHGGITSTLPLRLQYFIIITGAVYFVFAFMVPTISAMRRWLGISFIFTFTYIGILLVILVKDGNADDSRNNRNYKIKGNQVDKVFNAFGAIAAILVCSAPALLPEIQSTLRNPAVKNMRKALSLQFTIGLAFYYGVSILGYWAYGSTVSEYLPRELSGPKWAKVVINALQFLQSIISQHMFIAPVHEALDTKYMKLDESMDSMSNVKRRLILRAGIFAANTFITAAFPFMGDFVNLFGSFTLFPLTLVFPSMLFLKIKGKKAGIGHKAWHWANIIVFSLVAVVTTASAVKLVVNNVKVYHFFADT